VSRENVAFVLAGYARLNAGERTPELSFWDENAVYVNSAADPDAAAHEGIDAITRLSASWLEAYPDLRVEPLEARGHRDMVFLWVRFAGHGAASGLPMEMEWHTSSP
jgi:SnoaL-like domain